MDNALIPLLVDHQKFTYLNTSTMSSVCPKLKMKKQKNSSHSQSANSKSTADFGQIDVGEQNIPNDGYRDVAL